MKNILGGYEVRSNDANLTMGKFCYDKTDHGFNVYDCAGHKLDTLGSEAKANNVAAFYATIQKESMRLYKTKDYSTYQDIVKKTRLNFGLMEDDAPVIRVKASIPYASTLQSTTSFGMPFWALSAGALRNNILFNDLESAKLAFDNVLSVSDWNVSKIVGSMNYEPFFGW